MNLAIAWCATTLLLIVLRASKPPRDWREPVHNFAAAGLAICIVIAAMTVGTTFMRVAFPWIGSLVGLSSFTIAIIFIQLHGRPWRASLTIFERIRPKTDAELFLERLKANPPEDTVETRARGLA